MSPRHTAKPQGTAYEQREVALAPFTGISSDETPLPWGGGTRFIWEDFLSPGGSVNNKVPVKTQAPTSSAWREASGDKGYAVLFHAEKQASSLCEDTPCQERKSRGGSGRSCSPHMEPEGGGWGTKPANTAWIRKQNVSSNPGFLKTGCPAGFHQSSRTCAPSGTVWVMVASARHDLRPECSLNTQWTILG